VKDARPLSVASAYKNDEFRARWCTTADKHDHLPRRRSGAGSTGGVSG
jgi:hypothetical protein